MGMLQRVSAPVVVVWAMLFAGGGNAAWPERPLRYIVPSAPGGGPDVAARIIMAELGRQVGQQVIVDNRPGGSGTIGTDIIARATPDGYNMGHGNILTMAIGRSVLPKLPYDVDRDIQPVVHMYGTPNLLAVTLTLPVDSVQALIAHAKKRPNELLFASTGAGSSIHVGMELFKIMTNTQMVHVPFKAASVAIIDLTAGRVHLMADNINSIGPHVKAGRLRGLAVTSGRRVPAFAELPTIAESGFPGFEATSWFGLMAPAKTPAPIVAKVQEQAVKIAAMPDIRAKLTALGLDTTADGPDAFAAIIKADTAKWAKVIKDADIKVGN